MVSLSTPISPEIPKKKYFFKLTVCVNPLYLCDSTTLWHIIALVMFFYPLRCLQTLFSRNGDFYALINNIIFVGNLELKTIYDC